MIAGAASGLVAMVRAAETSNQKSQRQDPERSDGTGVSDAKLNRDSECCNLFLLFLFHDLLYVMFTFTFPPNMNFMRRNILAGSLKLF